MSKYNTKTEPVIKKVETLQGGSGYSQTDKKELISLLSTGLTNTFYEKEDEREKRFTEVLNKVAAKDKLFAAKALIYARTIFGQRTISHYGAVNLIPFLSGDSLGKKFFSKRDKTKKIGGIIYRIDDMHEILACYLAKNGKDASIPNSIKKGFKDAIEHADAYTLAKYQQKGKSVSLVDIVNIVHPVETSYNGTVEVSYADYKKAITGTKFEKINREFVVSETETIKIPTLHALVIGLLKQFNTVEDKNTEAGQVVAAKVKSGEITKEAAQVELAETKGENFAELIKTGKIGYLALLRNLRNILKLNDLQLLIDACALLDNQAFIKKSLVMPHEIDLALEIMIQEFSGVQLQKVAIALQSAYEKAVPNLAEYFNTGRTGIIVDVSGSMSTFIRTSDNKIGSTSALKKGSLVAATLAKGIGADIYVFADKCAKKTFNPLDSIRTISDNLIKQPHNVGGGTNWSSIFSELEKQEKYDRIFIISDEQDSGRVETTYTSYCKKFGTPNIFIINICGYGPTVLKESAKVHRIFGYTSSIYDTVKKVEIDYDSVIKDINSINI